jgi:hypothetical protein
MNALTEGISKSGLSDYRYHLSTDQSDESAQVCGWKQNRLSDSFRLEKNKIII